MIHKTKRFEIHENFFHIADRVLDLNKYKNTPLTTDREKAITESIKRINIPLVLCTNHIIRDVKFWISKNRSNGVSKAKGQRLIQMIKELIESDTKSNFKNIKGVFQDEFKDDSLILNYVNVRLMSDIENYAATFRTKKFSAFEGKAATSNQSEAFNYILKSTTNWKENKPDMMCLIFYYLQNYYLNEFSRASRGLGNYHTSKYFPKNYEFDTVDSFIHYEKIIEHVKREIKNVLEFQEDKERITAISMAQYSIDKNYISHNPNLKCFTIRSFRDEKKCYVVKLYPKPTCSCPVKKRCYHILACEMSVGMENLKEKSNLNISELVEVNEKGMHSKSGKKHFRKIDSQKEIEKNSSFSEKLKENRELRINLNSSDISTDYDLKLSDTENDNSLSETDIEFESETPKELEIIEEKLKSKEEVKNHFQNLRDRVYSIVMGGREKIWQRNKKRNLHPYFNVELFEWEDFGITKPLKKLDSLTFL